MAFAGAFPETPRAPAVLAEDRRGVVASMQETRDRASQLGERLELLEAAGAGLTRVQILVGRLRDAAVVAVDHGLQPADRATLQRQVDVMLTEIDTIADSTPVDEGRLRTGTSTGASNEARLTPFRALSTGALGIVGLAVRSSDQALAAAGALDVASARLERSVGALGSATARLQDTMDGLVNPATTGASETPITSLRAALSATTVLRSQLLAHPQEAARAQASLDGSRVRWLLDSPLS